jgi:hypothetical protein
MALQHLRSSTLDKRPVPSSMSDGQLAINTNLASPGLFFKDSNGDLVKVGPVHVGTTAPNVSPAVGGQAGNSKGEFWLDTTGGGYVLKVYDGTAWRTADGSYVNVTGDTMTGNLTLDASSLVFDTGTFNTTVSATTATAARTITIPDATGTLVTTGDTGSVTSAMLADGTIVDGDISSTAEIAVSKLADGTARQLLQTDAAGTGVEWTSNIDIPGTLDVTGAAVFDSTVTTAGDLTLNAQADLRFADSDSSNWVAFQAPATVATNVTWTLPAADGSANQVLQTNGTGTLSWATPASGGGDVLLASNNAFTGANTFYNGTGQTFGTATSTQDGIRLTGRAGGTTSLRVTLVPGTLTASRTLTLPDTTGTVITTGDSSTVTNTMLAGSIADSKLNTISTGGKVSGTAITSGNISTSGSFATTSTLAVGQSSAAANTDFDLAGTYAQTVVAVPALAIDCSTGNYFTKTINGASTFTVSNVPASRSYSFTLELTHTSGAITWFSGVEWPGATAPTLTTGKTHLFMFVTDDGGTRWRASSLINYTN